MKKVNIVFVLMLVAQAVLGQENDSSLLRQLKVKTIDKYLYVHAFQGKMDTCLYFHQELNEEFQPVFESVNMGCYGFGQKDDYTYHYNNSELQRIEVQRNGEDFSRSIYEFVKPGMASSVQTFYYQTNDSSVTQFTYFEGKNKQPDSTIMIEVNPEGDTSFTKTIPRFDELGRAVELVAIDENREPVHIMSFELLSNGEPASVATTMYGENSGFSQTYYEYNKKGRLIKTYNNRNQTQEYSYLENGLIKSVMNYNTNGELESEIIMKYEYR